MKKTIFAVAATLMAISACSPETSSKIDSRQNAVDLGLERLGSRNAMRAGGAQFSDGIFVGASPERHNSSALLPARLQTPNAVQLRSRDPMTLDEITTRLSEITGIPHIMALGPTGRLVSAQDSNLLSASEASPGLMDGADSSGRPQPRNGASVRAHQPKELGITMRPDLRGTLSDVLNQVTSTFEVEWSYTDGRVLFRDYVTRKYQITALPATSGQSTSIGSNSITSSSTLNSDVWAEVRETLAGLVGEGSAVSIGATTGLVTVTAKVSDQDRVEEYIEQLNGSVGQQISFDVQVLTVSLNDENSFGLDLGAALAGSDGGLKIGSAPYSSGGSLGDYNIGVLSGDFSLGAVVNALSKQGSVSISTRAGATTSNNRAAPIEVVDETPYLSEVTIEEDDDGDDRILRSTDTVTTGFQMQLFPRIMNNRDIMVQYTVRLSELNGIRTFGDGNESIQMPDVSTTSFEQQAVLENGQTLILAGFERERLSRDRKGNITGLKGMGGSKADSQERVATVMMITPRIINRTKPVR
ncbi:hypothetical protein KUV57_13110 [Epibacterium sp. DP7N7-1]|nr:hypothetical protein [Epibacterium sp. DP7N7-1]